MTRELPLVMGYRSEVPTKEPREGRGRRMALSMVVILKKPSVHFEVKPKVCVPHLNDAYKVPNIWQGVFNHMTLGGFYFCGSQFPQL